MLEQLLKLFLFDTTYFYISFLLYLFSACGHLAALFSKRRRVIKSFSYITLLCAFISHSAFLILRGFRAGHLPLVNLYESLNFFAWAVVFIYLTINWRNKFEALGAFALPLVFIIIFFSTLVNKDISSLMPALQSPWLGIHVALCFLSYSYFAVAFCLALIYIIQEKQIKSKRLGFLFSRLPPLEETDYMDHRSIAFGFIFLSLGIITGSVWAQVAWGSYWSWDPKETWSLITWFVYAGYLHARLRVGYRGRKAAYLAIIGFLAVLFTYLGVSFLLPGLHSYL